MARRKVQRLPTEDPLLEWLAWLMDNSVRVGPYSIGLDGFLGLIPGVGDLTGSVVSAFIIKRAIQTGVSKGAILRMVLNVGIDSVLGLIPFAGDIFDFAFKANARNVAIYREALRGDQAPIKDWGFVFLVIVLMLVFIGLPIVLFLVLLRTFLGN